MKQPTEFFGNVPILFPEHKEHFTIKERTELIMETPSSFHGKEEVSPVENIAFLIDRNALAHVDNWTKHECGSFDNFSRNYVLLHKDSKSKQFRKDLKFSEVRVIYTYLLDYKNYNEKLNVYVL